MRSRMLDFILASIIVLSGSFIGYRLLVNKGASTTGYTSIDTPAQIQKGSATPPPDTTEFDSRNKIPSGFAQKILLKIKPQTKKDWDAGIAGSGGSQYLVEQSDACKNPVAPIFYGYTVLIPAVKLAIKNHQLRVVNDGLGRLCIKKGSAFSIVSVGFEWSENALEVIGSATVGDIFQIPLEKMTAPLASAFGFSLEDFLRAHTVPARAGNGKVSFIRFDKLEAPIFDKQKPVRAFPRTPLISPTALSTWLGSHPGATIIDVRSQEEAARLPINYKGALVNIPYVPKDGKTAFRWNKSVADVSADKFDLGKILSADELQQAAPVDRLVIGTSAEDGRVPWALYSLLTLRVDRVFWYYEGAASFNQSIKSSANSK